MGLIPISAKMSAMDTPDAGAHEAAEVRTEVTYGCSSCCELAPGVRQRHDNRLVLG